MNENVARVMKENGYYGTVKEKPDTEKELFDLQDKLFEKREEYDKAVAEWIKDTSKPKPIDHSVEPWTKMFFLIYNYASSLVKKATKGKKFIEPDEISDKAMDATYKFMSTYNRRPDFAIGASFAGNLRFKVQEVTQEKVTVSLNSPSSYDAQLELLDTLEEESFTHVGGSRNLMRSPEDLYIEDSTDTLSEVLQELDAEVGANSKIAFLTRLYLLINLRVPKTRHIRRLFMENWADSRIEKVLESTILEIYNRGLSYFVN